MVAKYSDKGSPRWLDVADYMNEVGKAHNGYLRVRIASDVSARAGYYLQVSVEFWPRGRKPSEGFTAQEYIGWPHSDFRSMTAALVALTLRLDFQLTQRSIAAMAQAMF